MTNFSNSGNLTFSKNPIRKLQTTVTSRSVKGKEYRSFRIVLSKRLVRILDWKVAMMIEEQVVGDGLLLKPMNAVDARGF